MKNVHLVRELNKIEQYLFLPEAFVPCLSKGSSCMVCVPPCSSAFHLNEFWHLSLSILSTKHVFRNYFISKPKNFIEYFIRFLSQEFNRTFYNTPHFPKMQCTTNEELEIKSDSIFFLNIFLKSSSFSVDGHCTC